jgi:hypothetical protein
MLFFLLPSLFAAKIDKVIKNHDKSYDCLENVQVDIEDDVLIFTCKYDHDMYIEITDDHKLYISGERIHLNRYQQRLVGDYYDHFMEIMERAKEIGKEGAKIGLEGAKIGLLAAKSAMKMLVSDYDLDDFEREIEDDTEELELRTEELEEMAEELEEVAEEFDDLHYTMKHEIDELNDLDWF